MWNYDPIYGYGMLFEKDKLISFLTQLKVRKSGIFIFVMHKSSRLNKDDYFDPRNDGEHSQANSMPLQ